jgi:LDH2 family malate/lactate/ureidoglycolate dehydrogenase
LRGVDTHGLCRLPIYLDRVRHGLINPRPALAPRRLTPVAAALDGNDGFGFVVGMRAMREAIEMARGFGIGIVAVRRSTHFGMAASYVLHALDAGFISLVFSNASPAMPPWGGRAALLGTNPFAAGAPAGTHAPFLLDMSPAVAARGKIRRAERRGEQIPLGYALDGEGRPTTDPKAALGGVVLPIGAYKGSGLAMLMDIFGGVISGAAFGGEVGDQYKVYDRPQDVGHFFLAMKPDLFVTEGDYRARMDTLIERGARARPRPASTRCSSPANPSGATKQRGGGPASPTAPAKSPPCRTRPLRPASRRCWCSEFVWPTTVPGTRTTLP